MKHRPQSAPEDSERERLISRCRRERRKLVRLLRELDRQIHGAAQPQGYEPEPPQIRPYVLNGREQRPDFEDPAGSVIRGRRLSAVLIGVLMAFIAALLITSWFTRYGTASPDAVAKHAQDQRQAAPPPASGGIQDRSQGGNQP